MQTAAQVCLGRKNSTMRAALWQSYLAGFLAELP
jgi:hypothetical protein